MNQNLDYISSPSSSYPESGVNSPHLEQSLRTCPLCSSEVRLFFINFHEKLLMCENDQCEFPFGYEELQIVRFESPYEDDMNEDSSSRSQRQHSSPPSSVVSTSNSEIDRLYRVCKSEDPIGQMEPKILNTPFKVSKKILTKGENESKIKKNVEDLKGIAIELNDITKPKKTIANEKFIKNLRFLQDQSGLQLLKPEEIKMLNKKEKLNVSSDLKIDIKEPEGGGCVSSVTIEMTDQNGNSNKVK